MNAAFFLWDFFLGHKLSFDLGTNLDVEHQFLLFNRKANGVISTFDCCCAVDRVDILHTYACSFYGSQLWDLNKVTCIHTAYRKAVRKALCLSHRTRSRLLPVLCKRPSIEAQLINRFIKFCNVCRESDDVVLPHLISDRSCLQNRWSVGVKIWHFWKNIVWLIIMCMNIRMTTSWYVVSWF